MYSYKLHRYYILLYTDKRAYINHCGVLFFIRIYNIGTYIFNIYKIIKYSLRSNRSIVSAGELLRNNISCIYLLIYVRIIYVYTFFSPRNLFRERARERRRPAGGFGGLWRRVLVYII